MNGTLIMACPFAVHIALGGIKNSGGVMLWSFLCPMGAAFFRSAKESMIWFWIYLGISAGLLSWEVWDATSTSSDGTSDATAAGDDMGGDSSSWVLTRRFHLSNPCGFPCRSKAARFISFLESGGCACCGRRWAPGRQGQAGAPATRLMRARSFANVLAFLAHSIV